jgi:hypothetical protein
MIPVALIEQGGEFRRLAWPLSASSVMRCIADLTIGARDNSHDGMDGIGSI